MAENKKTSALVSLASIPVGAYLPLIDPNESDDADKNKRWTPAGAAVADVDDSALPSDGAIAGITEPGDGTIAALTFSATPTQAECEALRDQCEILRDALATLLTDCEGLRDTIAAQTITIETLRDRLKRSGGVGLIADS